MLLCNVNIEKPGVCDEVAVALSDGVSGTCSNAPAETVLEAEGVGEVDTVGVKDTTITYEDEVDVEGLSLTDGGIDFVRLSDIVVDCEIDVEVELDAVFVIVSVKDAVCVVD